MREARPRHRGRADAQRAGGAFFAPNWRGDEVGLLLDAGVDWDEVAELIVESYCLLAPRSLAALVDRPAD